MYKEYHPSPLLSPYIDKYWEFKGQPGYGMHINILPDGCTDFIFTLGEAPKAVHDSLVMQPYHAYFIGAMTKYSELVTHTVTVHMLGIRFLPCGILRFMDLPLQELTNLRLNADELTSLFTHSFAERLGELGTIQEHLVFIENFLLQALCRYSPKTERSMLFAIQQINRCKGDLSLLRLAEEGQRRARGTAREAHRVHLPALQPALHAVRHGKRGPSRRILRGGQKGAP